MIALFRLFEGAVLKFVLGFQAVSKRRDVGFRVDGKEMKGHVLKLHHVKWMESHDLELQEGIMVTLKVTSVTQ